MSILDLHAEALRKPQGVVSARALAGSGLGILIVVSSSAIAKLYQEAFDPRVVKFLGVGETFMGIVRAIFIATEAYVNSIRHSEVALASFRDYLDNIRCRLAHDCTDNFFVI